MNGPTGASAHTRRGRCPVPSGSENRDPMGGRGTHPQHQDTGRSSAVPPVPGGGAASSALWPEAGARTHRGLRTGPPSPPPPPPAGGGPPSLNRPRPPPPPPP